ncbi:flagellar motor protein MotD [Gilvimarinus polysaccharolyticus]|uniref:flagellar motor protein MotD n=1 Tax=Gilvimarinus polysaccharolyticus TaxID=863921 RepID=UPI0006736733|nr:flagellar motor protein MotD [Gilvimarinus polysaccharolyticus]
MPRRRPRDLTVNHERWLVSYADFITLLFAFFVVMYSISQVNESKYRVLSSTLTDAFDSSPRTAHSKLGTGQHNTAVPPIPNTPLGDHKGNLDQLEAAFKSEFAELIDDQLMQVSSNEMWLQVELRDSILFSSGSADVSNAAREIFTRVAEIISSVDNPVQIEGFTDNVPIQTSRYPSNWELSAARAAAIVKWLIDAGVGPARLAAVGYGKYQPVASNDTADGRTKNRRVAIMIARDHRVRPQAITTNINSADNPKPTLPSADIKPVELDGGALLYSSDPDLPRTNNGQ